MIGNTKTHLIAGRIYAALYLSCAIGPLMAFGLEAPVYAYEEGAIPRLVWYAMLIGGGAFGCSAAWAGDLHGERRAMGSIVFALGSYAMAVLFWGAGIPDASVSDFLILLSGIVIFGPIRIIWHIKSTRGGLRLYTYRPIEDDAK